MSVPIYHQTCDDLGIYPQAMRRRSHEQFMRDHRQAEWYAAAVARMYVAPVPLRGPARKATAKRPARKRTR